MKSSNPIRHNFTFIPPTFLRQRIRIKTDPRSFIFPFCTADGCPFRPQQAAFHSVGFEMPCPCLTRPRPFSPVPMEELGGKRVSGARCCSHFLWAGGRAGRRWWRSSLGSLARSNSEDDHRSSRDAVLALRKAPWGLGRCLRGANSRRATPGLEAGGPSSPGARRGQAAHSPAPTLTSSPPRPLGGPEACGAGAKRGGECGRGAWARGLAGWA